jgi:seryl-tRNA synthetase
MYDIRLLRDQMDHLREGMRRRGKLDELAPALDRAEALEKERREAIGAAEAAQARRNKSAQEVGRLRRQGENADALIAEGRAIADELTTLESRRQEVEAELSALLLEIPNITLDEVPEGGEEANVEVRRWGTPRAETDAVKPHWEVGEQLGLLDLPRGAKITGSGFIVYRGAGARLVRAMMNFMLDMHGDAHGYEEVWVPLVVNRESLTGTGQLPKFEHDMYGVGDDDLFLIPTAEVPITNLYRDELLAADVLPLALTGFSACFRREAGSAGKDTRGLLRVHEFDKVELVRYTTPERSREELELLLQHAEAILQALELPYRVLLLAAGDTGFASAMTYDLEVYSPGVGQWLEVSSCSVFTDFQARRANIRYRPGPKEKPQYVHTLNGSALAFSRVIAAILEHHQQPDGTVRVPEALQRYLGRDTLG